jgi:hypothetical protein
LRATDRVRFDRGMDEGRSFQGRERGGRPAPVTKTGRNVAKVVREESALRAEYVEK